jgi:two-component system, NarL family, response regulator NreC
MLREGLAVLIDAQPDMCVVAQASDGQEASALCLMHSPDVVVIDVSMPGSKGGELAEYVRDYCPKARVLALTRHSAPGYVQQMMRAGARGYVLKRSAADGLIQAIRTVASGGSYVDPTLAGALMSRSYGMAEVTPGKPSVHAPLSEREEEVLRLIAWGLSNKEIAHRLALSVKTIESYKATALQKLGIRTRADILRHAMEHRWLEDDLAPD